MKKGKQNTVEERLRRAREAQNKNVALPGKSVHEEQGERLRSMRETFKNRAVLDRERLMRELRATRLQADQLENYLASLNSSYRGAADYQRRIQGMVKRAYGEQSPDTATPGMPPKADLLRYYPSSYQNIRRIAEG